MFGIVAVDGEAVRRALPACQAPVLDGDPQIVVPVLDDGLDVVARQPAAGTARVGVAEQLMAVVAHQAVFGGEPHEALRILQGREYRPLRQAVRCRQVLENERRICGARAGTRSQQARRCGDQRRGADAARGVRAHALKMHEAGAPCVDRLQGAPLPVPTFTRAASQSAYWFGTQSTMEAGEVALVPDVELVHHGTDLLQV